MRDERLEGNLNLENLAGKRQMGHAIKNNSFKYKDFEFNKDKTIDDTRFFTIEELGGGKAARYKGGNGKNNESMVRNKSYSSKSEYVINDSKFTTSVASTALLKGKSNSTFNVHQNSKGFTKLQVC